jgi:hypothetical protein
VFTITDLGTLGRGVGRALRRPTDTLYAAGTNGEVQVYEDFTGRQGAAGPDRTIIPTRTARRSRSTCTASRSTPTRCT